MSFFAQNSQCLLFNFVRHPNVLASLIRLIISLVHHSTSHQPLNSSQSSYVLHSLVFVSVFCFVSFNFCLCTCSFSDWNAFSLEKFLYVINFAWFITVSWKTSLPTLLLTIVGFIPFFVLCGFVLTSLCSVYVCGGVIIDSFTQDHIKIISPKLVYW